MKDPKTVAAVGGVLIYIILNQTYRRFYDTLGVDPNDVGLNYINTLVKSAEILLAVSILSSVFAAAGWIIVALVLFHSLPFLVKLRRSMPIGLGILAFLVLFSLLYPIPERAFSQANAVREGRPLAYRYWGPIARDITFRADPAFIEVVKTDSELPVDKTQPAPATREKGLNSLQGRLMIYLGQSNGVIVLYDGRSKQALYLPASGILLKVGRCRSQTSPSPGCDLAWV